MVVVVVVVVERPVEVVAVIEWVVDVVWRPVGLSLVGFGLVLIAGEELKCV